MTFSNNMSARGKRKAVDLTVCISPKKKKEPRDKAAAKEHGKNRGKAKKQKTSKKKATGKAAGRKKDYSTLKRIMPSTDSKPLVMSGTQAIVMASNTKVAFASQPVTSAFPFAEATIATPTSYLQ